MSMFRLLNVIINFVSRYDVAEPNDLFTSFDYTLLKEQYIIENGLTVRDFMSNWTTQAGYPVLNITKNKNTNTFLVTQVIYKN